MKKPKPGQIVDGYIFLGGDEKDESRWAPQPGLFDSLMAGDVRGMAQAAPVLTGVGQGVQEMGANLRSNLGMEPSPPVAANAEELHESTMAHAPGATEFGRMGARMTPGLLIAPGSLPGQIAAAGGLSLLEENPGWAAAFNLGGLGVGRLAGNLLGRGGRAAKHGARPIREIAEEVDAAPQMRRAQDSGARFSRYEATQTRGNVEEAARSHPWTRRFFENTDEENARILNHALADSIGTDVTRFTDDALPTIKETLNARYTNLFDSFPPIELPDGFVKDFRKIVPNIVYKKFKELLRSGPIKGSDYKKLRAAISKQTAAGQNKPEAIELMSMLDDHVRGQVPDQLLEVYDTMREQWRNFFAVAKVRGRTSGGRLSPYQARSALRGEYGTVRPRNPETIRAREIADALAGKPYLRSSGTAERNTIQEIMREILTSPKALAGLAAQGSPPAAASQFGAYAGRNILHPEMRQQTPYYPED